MAGRGMWGHRPMRFGTMRDVHAMGDVDSEYDYLSSMIPHHEEATETARILSGFERHPEVDELARRIRDAQLREVRQMNDWLRESY